MTDPSLSFLPHKQRCPNCNAVYDVTAAAEVSADERSAEPGDCVVCLYCGHFTIVADDGSLRLPTPKEADEIANDPEAQEARAKVLAFRTQMTKRH